MNSTLTANGLEAVEHGVEDITVHRKVLLKSRPFNVLAVIKQVPYYFSKEDIKEELYVLGQIVDIGFVRFQLLHLVLQIFQLPLGTKVVASLAEFVYNLTACPIPREESKNRR